MAKRKNQALDYLQQWAQQEQLVLRIVAGALVIAAVVGFVNKPFNMTYLSEDQVETAFGNAWIFNLGFPLALLLLAGFTLWRPAQLARRRDYIEQLIQMQPRTLQLAGVVQLALGVVLIVSNSGALQFVGVISGLLVLILGGMQLWRARNIGFYQSL